MRDADAMDAINFANEWQDLGWSITQQIDHICSFDLTAIRHDEVNPNAIRAAKESGVYGCNAEIDTAIDEYLAAVVAGRFNDCDDFDPPDDPTVIAALIECDRSVEYCCYCGSEFSSVVTVRAHESKCLATPTSRNKSLVLDLDKDDDEYTVVWIESGQIDGKNCYFTDWLDDAINTREDMKRRAEAKGFTVTLTESIDIEKEKK